MIQNFVLDMLSILQMGWLVNVHFLRAIDAMNRHRQGASANSTNIIRPAPSKLVVSNALTVATRVRHAQARSIIRPGTSVVTKPKHRDGCHRQCLCHRHRAIIKQYGVPAGSAATTALAGRILNVQHHRCQVLSELRSLRFRQSPSGPFRTVSLARVSIPASASAWVTLALDACAVIKPVNRNRGTRTGGPAATVSARSPAMPENRGK